MSNFSLRSSSLGFIKLLSDVLRPLKGFYSEHVSNFSLRSSSSGFIKLLSDVLRPLKGKNLTSIQDLYSVQDEVSDVCMTFQRKSLTSVQCKISIQLKNKFSDVYGLSEDKVSPILQL